MKVEEILNEVKKIQDESMAYKKTIVKKEDDDTTVVPSNEFMDELFKECSSSLGFEYEN